MSMEPDHVFVIDGKTYALRMGDVTSQIAMEFRRQTGMKLMEFMGSGFDLDSAGVVVWLCRRINGERVTLDEVLESVSFNAITEGAAEEPEAQPTERRNGAHDERLVAKDIAQDPEVQGVAF